MQVPLSLDECVRQMGASAGGTQQDFEQAVGNCRHHSCWGEWSLGILSGSENVDLGLELVNNLMSSHKVCSRAEACAAIPTVEFFYDLHGDAPCVDIPGRHGLELPRTTWNELRRRFFRGARTRHRIFDYRHTMAEVHALLQYVRHNAREAQGALLPRTNDIRDKLMQTLTRICRLNGRRILTQ
jgi:hypothetical protein